MMVMMMMKDINVCLIETLRTMDVKVFGKSGAMKQC